MSYTQRHLDTTHAQNRPRRSPPTGAYARSWSIYLAQLLSFASRSRSQTARTSSASISLSSRVRRIASPNPWWLPNSIPRANSSSCSSSRSSSANRLLSAIYSSDISVSNLRELSIVSLCHCCSIEFTASLRPLTLQKHIVRILGTPPHGPHEKGVDARNGSYLLHALELRSRCCSAQRKQLTVRPAPRGIFCRTTIVIWKIRGTPVLRSSQRQHRKETRLYHWIGYFPTKMIT